MGSARAVARSVHASGAALTSEVVDVPFYTCEYDFRLAPAQA